MDQDTRKSKVIDKSLSQLNGVASENSSNSVKEAVLGTVIVTNTDEASSIGRENRLEIVIDEVRTSQGTCNSRVTDENSSNLVDEISLESVVVRTSEQNTSFSEEKRGFGLKIDEKGLSDTVENASETCNKEGISEGMCPTTDPGSSVNSSNMVEAVVLETVVVVKSDQTACLSIEKRQVESKNNELGSRKALAENLKGKVSVAEKESHGTDLNCGGGDGKYFKESSDGERVCRICHLSSEQSSETAATIDTVSTSKVDLIQLGCGCKDELGIAHSHCAEAWFKLKGNRLCEICGQTAKNVTGVGDCRFMEEWNEHRFVGSSSSSERGGCWRGQPFCNFLMACLVIAFVLPWFFHVDMF